MSMMEVDPLTGLPRQRRPQNQRQLESMANTFAAQPRPSGYSPTSSGVPQITIRGQQPNYQDLIQNDPLFRQMRADLGAQGVQDAASRAAQTQRALVLFGQVPSFDALAGLNPEWLNQDVTAQTRQLAQQNTDAGLSLAARQQEQFKNQVREIRNALAARGALRSGESAHQLQQAQTGYDRAKFDATQELMDFISGLQAGFAQAERGRQSQLGQGAAEAAGRVPDQARTPDIQASEIPGSGVYRGTDGMLYNADGTPYQEPAASGPSEAALQAIKYAVGGRNFQAL